MSEWRIDIKEYLNRLDFTKKDFEKNLYLPNLQKVEKIIPLRDLQNIQSMTPIRHELLLYLIKKIKTLNKQTPFLNSVISMIKVDPRQLKIGQKYVYRENYQNLLEEVPEIFNHFFITTGGLGDLGAYFIFGYDANKNYCLACYVPPIIERHESELIIMDGIHRNYIAKQSGKSLTAIIIDDVELQFPCKPKSWPEIKIISLNEKPKEIKERYFDLNQDLFRDLKYLGIDG